MSIRSKLDFDLSEHNLDEAAPLGQPSKTLGELGEYEEDERLGKGCQV